MQFESIANFSAVIDRLGEFSEVLESSAIARPTSGDAQPADQAPEAALATQQSLINLVDQPGKPKLCVCRQQPSCMAVATVCAIHMAPGCLCQTLLAHLAVSDVILPSRAALAGEICSAMLLGCKFDAIFGVY